ncbi:hypothetical protein K435DRAFT_775201, partial [Dendrothele bispora CBS 962.96]
ITVPTFSPILDASAHYEYSRSASLTVQDQQSPNTSILETTIRYNPLIKSQRSTPIVPQPVVATPTTTTGTPDFSFLQRIAAHNTNLTQWSHVQQQTPLKHLTVLDSFTSGESEERVQGMTNTQLLEAVTDALLDEKLVEEDPFQAAMGLVFLTRTLRYRAEDGTQT